MRLTPLRHLQTFGLRAHERFRVWVWWESRSPPPPEIRLLLVLVGEPGTGGALSSPPLWPVACPFLPGCSRSWWLLPGPPKRPTFGLSDPFTLSAVLLIAVVGGVLFDVALATLLAQVPVVAIVPRLFGTRVLLGWRLAVMRALLFWWHGRWVCGHFWRSLDCDPWTATASGRERSIRVRAIFGSDFGQL